MIFLEYYLQGEGGVLPSLDLEKKRKKGAKYE